jgi:hypothetical protein
LNSVQINSTVLHIIGCRKASKILKFWLPVVEEYHILLEICEFREMAFSDIQKMDTVLDCCLKINCTSPF